MGGGGQEGRRRHSSRDSQLQITGISPFIFHTSTVDVVFSVWVICRLINVCKSVIQSSIAYHHYIYKLLEM